jgi:Family of unknown function (DUF6483)
MLRRDYLLRQIEQFTAVLLRMTGLTKAGQWEEASSFAKSQFKALAGDDISKLLQLSDTELIARLAEGDAGYGMEERIFMLARLFKENCDILKGQGRVEESSACCVKGLHLLLETIANDPTAPRPEFVPSVDEFLIALRDVPLDFKTNAMLMRHYEQARDYAKAEDALFNMLDADPANTELLNFGDGFYQRLLRLDDETLEVGNLPRAEIDTGLAELNQRKRELTKG